MWFEQTSKLELLFCVRMVSTRQPAASFYFSASTTSACPCLDFSGLVNLCSKLFSQNIRSDHTSWIGVHWIITNNAYSMWHTLYRILEDNSSTSFVVRGPLWLTKLWRSSMWTYLVKLRTFPATKYAPLVTRFQNLQATLNWLRCDQKCMTLRPGLLAQTNFSVEEQSLNPKQRIKCRLGFQQ